MIEGPPFLLFLHDDKMNFFYTDSAGAVMASQLPKPVKVTPGGMRELLVLFDRNKKYWGIGREFTVPIQWVLDGAKIIKRMYFRNGPESKINLLIVKQRLVIDADSYDFIYESFFKGEPDLTTYSRDGVYSTVNIIDAGLNKYFKANENQVYEIPISGSIKKTVFLDGIPLRETGNFIIVDELPISRNQYANNFWVPISYINSDGRSTGVSFTSSYMVEIKSNSFTDKIASTSYFATAMQNIVGPIDFTFSAKIKFITRNNDGAGTVRFRFLTSKMSLQDQDKYKLHTNAIPLGAVGSVHEIDVTATVTLRPGENLFLEGIYTSGSNGNMAIEFLPTPGFEFARLVYDNRYSPTDCAAVTLYDAFKALVNKLTDGLYEAESELLKANNKILLTCGNAVRGLADSVLKLSTSEFFTGVNLIPDIGPIGMGIFDNKLRIESIDFWLKGNIIKLGAVSNFKDSCASEFLFNSIKVGYVEQDLDLVNGKDEFNNTLEFTTPNLKSIKVYDLVSPWIAAPFYIEGLRVNLDGKNTTDSSGDNSKILLATDGLGKLDRSLNETTTGVTFPMGIFNIPLSPKRILLSHKKMLMTFLRGKETGELVYQTTEKNSKLQAGGITEAANVPIGSLGAPAFHAHFLDFDCAVPEDYNEQLLTNPIRRFEIEVEGVNLIGIAMKSAVSPGEDQPQSFSLLTDPSVNMQTLEEIGEY